jgi:hypothetical protein
LTRQGKAAKPRRDDLPAIHASRLRALRLIGPNMKTVRLELEGLAFDVGLAHTRFWNGGGWSYFICPCGRLARTLRLLEGRLVCRTCDGLLARCQLGDRPGQSKGDKGPPIARLIKRLEGPAKRRAWLELSLRRKLIVERERRVNGWKG